jgi:hypothetical protein
LQWKLTQWHREALHDKLVLIFIVQLARAWHGMAFVCECKILSDNIPHISHPPSSIRLLFAVITEEPEFTEVIENVTVPAGKFSFITLASELR